MIRTFPELGYDPTTGEWNDSLTGEFLWSNVNLSEAVPDVMTPSTWSLWWIFHYETNPITFPGNVPFCGNIGGRPYFNLSLLFSVYQAVGRDARKEMQGDIVGSASVEIDIPILPFSAFLVYRTVLPGTFQARGLMRRCQKDMPQFLQDTPAWCRATLGAIAGWTTPQSLLMGWQETFKPVMVQACQMLRTVTALLAGPASRLRRELADMVGEVDANAILSNLSGEGSLASLGPLLGLSQVVDGRLSREDYLERYGHRGPHEMELSAPGAADDPEWIEKQLAQFDRRQTDVDVLLTRQRAEQAAVWERFEARFPKKVREVRARLDQVAAAARAREAVRSEVTRLARLLRAYLLQAGAVSGLDEEVFFLSLDESIKVLSGDKTPVSRVPARRTAHERACTLPPYPTMIIGHFDPCAWAADPNRRSDFYDARHPVTALTSGILHGSAGAAGVVEGIVRRLDRPEDGDQLQVGEILVAVTTNVGWTPLFPRLRAVVTDVGAPLSHAAIVARELGIPAVVGCGDATARLKTGDRVRVDGGRGVVEILGQ
jgi:phosphohistidine swiveling domain-containing protein